MTGYIPYRPGSEVRSDAAGHSDGSARPQRVMPHINDLKARAEGMLEQTPQAIKSLLEVAQQSTKQLDYLIEIRRPDLAYIEYLIASEIVLNRVPSHKDAPIFREDRGRLYHLQKDLVKSLTGKADQFDNIKQIIINENKRSGVQPITALNGVYARRPEEQSNPNARYSMPNAASHRLSEYPRSTRSSVDASSQMSSGRSTPVSEPYRSRPPVNPKPQNLHSRAINGRANGASSPVDSLTERFAKLRTSASRQGNMPGTIPIPVPEQFNANGKPMGPRDMPNGIYGPPQLPPKLPLNTSFAGAMPQEPSPAYSPARNMSTPASINPPRSTVRSIVGTGGRSNSYAASSASSHAPNNNGDPDSYFPRPPSRQAAAQTIRRKSVHSPKEFQITAEKLYDYFKLYNVLVIDLRSREEFDEGHIYQRTIMNIEPTALRPNMSANELQEALVLSPDEEQDIFERRSDFDLVVYYDQSTASASYLKKAQRTQSEAMLKYLYDALYEFNDDKPLQRPPILLMGGLDAWEDLVGTSALASSRTAAIVSNNQNGRPSRPISRVPPARGARFRIQKKRLRDYNPLEPEEEEQWRQRARSERAVSGSAPVEEEEDEFVQYHRTTEDFMRRFPDPSTIEAQSMTSAPTHSYSKPPPLPSYAAPAVPAIPSRPLPAASRPSYSGVHDRNINHNQSVARSTALPSYFPPSRNLPLPRTGLINFGVTCYMNATIQCLNATLPVTSYYRDGTYQKYIQKENWRGSRGLMSLNYATLIQNMWQDGGGPCRPKTLRELCSRINGEWGIDRQQDAKEFFDFLVDVLHEDLNVVWSHPPAQALTEAEEAHRERLPKPYVAHIEWHRSCLRDRSLISEIFGGQHASRLRCLTCNFTSTTFEPFYSISVEIPRDRPADIRDCLRSYCAEERLQGDELWRCPHCKVEREATKQITITRAPRRLVLHLKRFSASHNETARKVRTPIEFPLQALDISPYMLPPITPAEEQELVKRGSHQELQHLKNDPTMNGPYLYSSYAVMRHQGNTLTSGHYVAMIRDKARGVWLQFNDERVTEFKPEALTGSQRLQNEMAYLLFYEREEGAL
ncbi:ubiquitin carboxyl-terminal hydrolase 2 [Saccharata proteae CBS 121410]|uniref:Ubiquitin carboxyl-terminal hydrolase 2 n=1 Tax=Saccharata proteae CBS 121410 TaxID=1314787 RepID=A0A9P4LU36_9PEZI|nr:ubiquitin carboxyl-terminal hydrolase 2 [Saccharata proteae CBS 121410]